MGAFVLLRREGVAAEESRVAAISRSFQNQGFTPSRRWETRFWTVLTYGKFCGPSAPVYNAQSGDFATYTGTFLHKQLTGVAALEEILRRFDGTSFPWDDVYGAYCAIVCRRGQLFLIPDRLGVYKVYRDEHETIVSSSFLAVLEQVERPVANRQSVYEYVFQGATYDDRTVIEQIRLLPRRALFRLDESLHRQDQEDDLRQGRQWRDFASHLQMAHGALREQFSALATAFGSNVETALSGGYDSRLLLALLREQNASPRIHVYGKEGDEDVIVAKAIAAGAHFPIAHIDKSRLTLPPASEFPAIVAKNMAALDGYPPDGIFDGGSDVATRSQRAASGAVALNGGGGEIFRNFFYLPDRPFTIRDVLWSFFAQFDPRVGSDAFVEEQYFEHMAIAIARLLGLAPDAPKLQRTRLSRPDVEYLYPCLRCVYWMGRNNAVNNRFGYAATPFIEPDLIRLTLQIPMRHKNHGIFEAALIHAVDPGLARYQSAYGQSFDQRPSLKRVLKDDLVLLRPMLARKLSYRLANRLRSRALAAPLTEEYLARVIDTSFPQMRRYFKIDQVKTGPEFNRICTLEYLFEKYPVNCAI